MLECVYRVWSAERATRHILHTQHHPTLSPHNPSHSTAQTLHSTLTPHSTHPTRRNHDAFTCNYPGKRHQTVWGEWEDNVKDEEDEEEHVADDDVEDDNVAEDEVEEDEVAEEEVEDDDVEDDDVEEDEEEDDNAEDEVEDEKVQERRKGLKSISGCQASRTRATLVVKRRDTR